MSVFCKVDKCPYNKSMWCSKPTVTLTVNGWCSELFKDDGNQKVFSEYSEYKYQTEEEINDDEG